MVSGARGAQPPDGSGASLEEAHRALRADRSLQFEVEEFTPPTPPSDFNPLGDFLRFIEPFLQVVFWVGVAALVALVLYAVVRELLLRRPGAKRAKKAAEEIPVPEFRPTQARARALLEEADRLAQEGRYSEAARVLLHRSIEDMERFFSITIGPARTSREIAAMDVLSTRGREVFSAIARAVETSLFGGRPLGAAEYGTCRSAYEAFAFRDGRA